MFSPKSKNISAIGTMTSILGVICGLSGFEHGFFEMLQGNIVPKSQMINAIGEANRFWQYGTEPAFTIIPNFFVTGILAMTCQPSSNYMVSPFCSEAQVWRYAFLSSSQSYNSWSGEVSHK